MKCGQIEILICDYIDGTLAAPERQQVRAHVETCAACAELLSDASAAAAFLSRVEPVEPPQELLTRLVFLAPKGAAPVPIAGTPASIWQRWFGPILQPRFAMGMAMTILSFSMVGRILGWQPRQLTAADLSPSKVWVSLEGQSHRIYDRAMKYYENLRLVYEIQTRLNEWSAEEEEDRKQAAGSQSNPAAGSKKQ